MVAVILVVLVGCVGSAYATRTVKLASHISIRSHHNTTFTGRVTSRNTGCEDARKVTLYTTTKLKLGTRGRTSRDAGRSPRRGSRGSRFIISSRRWPSRPQGPRARSTCARPRLRRQSRSRLLATEASRTSRSSGCSPEPPPATGRGASADGAFALSSSSAGRRSGSQRVRAASRTRSEPRGGPRRRDGDLCDHVHPLPRTPRQARKRPRTNAAREPLPRHTQPRVSRHRPSAGNERQFSPVTTLRYQQRPHGRVPAQTRIG